MKMPRGLYLRGIFLLAALTLGACNKSNDNPPAPSAAPGPGVQVTPDADARLGAYRAMGVETFNKLVQQGVLKPTNTAEAKEFLAAQPSKVKTNKVVQGQQDTPESKDPKKLERTLLITFPVKLLGEQNVFGGVITAASNRENEDQGMLKLMDVVPVHVRPLLGDLDTDQPQFRLVGCLESCSERSETYGLVNIPILAVDRVEETLVLDVADLGLRLNMVAMLDPDGEYLKMDADGSYATFADYSFSTLVFDVTSAYVTRDDQKTQVTFSTRWYLRLSSTFNPSFESRPATEGVGFFMTERSAAPKIIRHAVDQESANGSVHYYLKNVPEEHKASFAGAFDEWNSHFEKVIGRKLLSYEFVDQNDPRNAQIVTGDVRINVLEWDLNNLAPYGGLGPSIANQYTGETMSSNVLVQGPFIELIYKKWFSVQAEADRLESLGRIDEAQDLVARFQKSIKSLKEQKTQKYKISLGNIVFRNPADMAAYQDPALPRMDFERLPAGHTYETYMKGYWRDLVAHEMGHNLGLRHNFKGNLGAKAEGGQGGQSRSVMEYLSRPYRHEDEVGEYDTMALAYGYNGVTPPQKGWFCTDEDQPNPQKSFMSAECTNSDATYDPYSGFEKFLDQAISHLVNRETVTAPKWQVAEMRAELNKGLLGLAYYKTSAARSSKTWTNFFGREGRPLDAKAVPAYVANSMKSRICDPRLMEIANMKENDQAKVATIKNINDLKTYAYTLLVRNGLMTEAEVTCQ